MKRGRKGEGVRETKRGKGLGVGGKHSASHT